MKPRVRLSPLGSVEEANDYFLNIDNLDEITLAEFLQQAPSLSMDIIKPETMDKPLSEIRLSIVDTGETVPLYRPPAMQLTMPSVDTDVNANSNAIDSSNKTSEQNLAQKPVAGTKSEQNAAEEKTFQLRAPNEKLSEKEAIHIVYAKEIEDIASFLRAGQGLSVLVYCDKLIVEHLWLAITQKSAREARLLEIPDSSDGAGELMSRSLRQRQLSKLKQDILALKQGQVLVIPHLDLLAGGADNSLSNEARELTELVFSHTDRLILAFADRSMTIPEVLSGRFAVRRSITGVRRKVIDLDAKEKHLGEIFVTRAEAEHFIDYQAEDLYKNVAGMNPIQILHAISYAVTEQKSEGPVKADKLYQAIRAFKVQNSTNVEVPKVTFDDIGGYEPVKNILIKALNLMTGAYNLPDEALRGELIPRGFIFYGPPGTGKTLFAKAIANMLNATVQVVSGPEVTDMYVGESERKVREFFAEARRNAPSVLVFDEFDAIAAKRSGRDDGGSRAGNAIVAQLLTEMDGFRADVPMLVIGTTNQLGLIDEALLRPSRFQAVAIDLPDIRARYAIAEVHAKHFKIAEYITPELLEVIAEATEGFNGDEVHALFRDACVGLYCEEPPKKIDAVRFGELVGLFRLNKEQRIVISSSQSNSTRRSENNPIPGPSGPMLPLG